MCLVPAEALLIEMKDGRYYDGEIIGEQADVFIVKLKSGRRARLKKSKIAEIHRPAAEDGKFEYAPEKADAPEFDKMSEDDYLKAIQAAGMTTPQTLPKG